MLNIEKIIWPMYNFECSEDEIIFDEKTLIRSAKKEEIEEIKKIVGDKKSFSHILISNFVPMVAIYALRIFKSGFFFLPYVIHPNKQITRRGHDMSSYQKYIISKDDLQNLELFIDFFVKNRTNFRDKYPSLYSSIWLFCTTLEEPIHHVRIINFFNCLEALFLKGGEVGELSFRLSMRVAHFLGEHKEEKKKLYNLIKHGYEARSKIIHGMRKMADHEDFRLSAEIEDCVRKSLKKYLTMIFKFPSVESMIDSIDDSILE